MCLRRKAVLWRSLQGDEGTSRIGRFKPEGVHGDVRRAAWWGYIERAMACDPFPRVSSLVAAVRESAFTVTPCRISALSAAGRRGRSALLDHLAAHIHTPIRGENIYSSTVRGHAMASAGAFGRKFCELLIDFSSE